MYHESNIFFCEMQYLKVSKATAKKMIYNSIRVDLKINFFLFFCIKAEGH